MPFCQTKYFGTFDYSDQDAITFPTGLVGYEQESRFILLSYPDQYPLVYLQSVVHPEICLAALPVLAVDKKYRLQLAAGDAELLGVSTEPAIGSEVLCLVVVTARDYAPTANLLAPIVVNLHNRLAAQCFHADGWYSHQHPILAAEQAGAA